MSEIEILKELIAEAYKNRTVDGLHFESEYSAGYTDALEWALKKMEDNQPTFTEDQQIIFDWLKTKNTDFVALIVFYSINASLEFEMYDIWSELSKKQQYQVLQAYTKWMADKEEK